MLFNGYELLAQHYTSRTLSIQHGLPEYYVSGLVQDQAGFIWVATRDGLARYDGRQFNVFRHQPFRNRLLANNVISSLQSVSDTTLLIHLENGSIQLFNPVTERFTDLFTTKLLQQNRIKLANAQVTNDKKQVWGRFETQFIQFDRMTRQFQVYPFPHLPALGHYPDTVVSWTTIPNACMLPFRDN
ncbi:MAG: hypothetical protein EOP49_45640 [Sphingobacteriales bacterium]|nr:MAG: hypothetical protein EOP49_45640 [Sphingobacteriales bacterium]